MRPGALGGYLSVFNFKQLRFFSRNNNFNKDKDDISLHNHHPAPLSESSASPTTSEKKSSSPSCYTQTSSQRYGPQQVSLQDYYSGDGECRKEHRKESHPTRKRILSVTDSVQKAITDSRRGGRRSNAKSNDPTDGTKEGNTSNIRSALESDKKAMKEGWYNTHLSFPASPSVHSLMRTMELRVLLAQAPHVCHGKAMVPVTTSAVSLTDLLPMIAPPVIPYNEKYKEEILNDLTDKTKCDKVYKDSKKSEYDITDKSTKALPLFGFPSSKQIDQFLLFGCCDDQQASVLSSVSDSRSSAAQSGDTDANGNLKMGSKGRFVINNNNNVKSSQNIQEVIELAVNSTTGSFLLHSFTHQVTYSHEKEKGEQSSKAQRVAMKTAELTPMGQQALFCGIFSSSFLEMEVLIRHLVGFSGGTPSCTASLGVRSPIQEEGGLVAMPLPYVSVHADNSNLPSSLLSTPHSTAGSLGKVSDRFVAYLFDDTGLLGKMKRRASVRQADRDTDRDDVTTTPNYLDNTCTNSPLHNSDISSLLFHDTSATMVVTTTVTTRAVPGINSRDTLYYPSSPVTDKELIGSTTVDTTTTTFPCQYTNCYGEENITPFKTTPYCPFAPPGIMSRTGCGMGFLGTDISPFFEKMDVGSKTEDGAPVVRYPHPNRLVTVDDGPLGMFLTGPKAEAWSIFQLCEEDVLAMIGVDLTGNSRMESSYYSLQLLTNHSERRRTYGALYARLYRICVEECAHMDWLEMWKGSNVNLMVEEGSCKGGVCIGVSDDNPHLSDTANSDGNGSLKFQQYRFGNVAFVSSAALYARLQQNLLAADQFHTNGRQLWRAPHMLVRQPSEASVVGKGVLDDRRDTNNDNIITSIAPMPYVRATQDIYQRAVCAGDADAFEGIHELVWFPLFHIFLVIPVSLSYLHTFMAGTVTTELPKRTGLWRFFDPFGSSGVGILAALSFFSTDGGGGVPPWIQAAGETISDYSRGDGYNTVSQLMPAILMSSDPEVIQYVKKRQCSASRGVDGVSIHQAIRCRKFSFSSVKGIGGSIPSQDVVEIAYGFGREGLPTLAEIVDLKIADIYRNAVTPQTCEDHYLSQRYGLSESYDDSWSPLSHHHVNAIAELFDSTYAYGLHPLTLYRRVVPLIEDLIEEASNTTHNGFSVKEAISTEVSSMAVIRVPLLHIAERCLFVHQYGPLLGAALMYLYLSSFIDLITAVDLESGIVDPKKYPQSADDPSKVGYTKAVRVNTRRRVGGKENHFYFSLDTRRDSSDEVNGVVPDVLIDKVFIEVRGPCMGVIDK